MILNHLRALQRVCPEKIDQVILMHGGRAAGLPDNFDEMTEFSVDPHSFPELEYDSERGGIAEQLPEKLEWTLRQMDCHPSDTILHAHNHSLGKNVAFLSAIDQLAENGWRWLLQIHDFAEDFRPANYRHFWNAIADNSSQTFGRRVYPQANQIHYAALNGRDREILFQAGVSAERLHTLPNPVFAFDDLPAHEVARARVNDALELDGRQRLLVYPVRGIRRKNVGEMLLWSAIGQGDWICALTLSPANPVEKRSYDEWKTLAERLQLPCHWEIGTKPTLQFEDILSAADHILTTSVAEGFGMVFLEAWLAGKPLCGRDLPEITRDFKQVGIWYPQLAANVLIPVEFVDLEAVRDDFLKAYRCVLEEFGLTTIQEAVLHSEFESLVAGGTIDFAVLTRAHQTKLIERIAGRSTEITRICELNPAMQSVFQDDREAQRDSIQTNAETVLSEFSLESTGQTLHNVYQRLMEAEPSGLRAPESPEAIRDGFLELFRFHPLRVEL